MINQGPGFLLPKKVESYLAALSKIYAADREIILQEVLVNAQIRVHEAWTARDDWGSEIYGHAIYLIVPEPIYLRIVKVKDKIQTRINKDINRFWHY